MLLPKGKNTKVTAEQILYENIEAPVNQGDAIGVTRYHLENEILAEIPITATEKVDKISFFELFLCMFGTYLIK